MEKKRNEEGGASFYRVLLNFDNFVYLSGFAPFFELV